MTPALPVLLMISCLAGAPQSALQSDPPFDSQSGSQSGSQSDSQSDSQSNSPSDSQSDSAKPGQVQTEGIERNSFRWAQAGDQSWILVATITLTPGWHVYWENPGDSGNPPSFELTLPTGWQAGPTVYPRPEARSLDGGIFYGYSRSANYLVPVRRAGTLREDPWKQDSDNAQQGAWSVRAKVMVCKERCAVATLLGDGTWPPVAEAGSGVQLNGGSFGGRSLPATAASAGLFARFENGKVSIKGPSQGQGSVRFIPASVPGMQLGMADGAVSIDGVVSGEKFNLEFTVTSVGEGPGQPAVAGLILLGNDASDPCVWLTIPHPLAGPGDSLGANGVGASDQAPPSK
jgi:hypothetical protein